MATIKVPGQSRVQIVLSPETVKRVNEIRPVRVDTPSRSIDVATPQRAVTISKEVRPVRIGNLGDGGGPSTPVTYENDNAMPQQVGGYPAGTTFSPPQTIKQMFDGLFYPYQAPAFTAFSIAGVSSPLEVGASFGPNVTFNWNTSNASNVETGSIAVSDITSSSSIFSGAANTGSRSVTLGTAVSRSSAGSHQFGISGENTHSQNFSGSLSLQWEWRLYFGTNASATLVASDILALGGSRLSTGYGSTFSFAAGGYKFICFADAAGGQINSVKDQATGFNVPMNPGSHTDGGGFGFELVTVTNAFSVSTSVRVYRTLNSLGGAITLVVT